MYQLFSSIFSPPAFSHEQRGNVARLLHSILLACVGISSVALPIFLIVSDEWVLNLTVFSFWIVVPLILMRLSHQGYVRVASSIFLGLFWLTGLYVAHYTIGVLSSYTYLFVVIILGAAILLDTKAAVYFALLSVAGVSLLLLNWQAYDVLAFYQEKSLLQRAFAAWNINVIAFVLNTILIIYAANAITRTFTQLQESRIQLSQRNRELETEIAERRRIEGELRNSETRFRQIFELAPLGLATFNQKGSIMQVNDAYAQLVGYEKEIMIGDDGKKWTHPDYITPDNQLLQDLFQRRYPVVKQKMQLIHKEGHFINVRATFAAVHNVEGQPQYGISLIEDNTEQERAEQQRVDLQVAQQKLDFLQDFTSQMTHDLKTPLSSISLSVDLIERYCDVPDKRQRHTHRVHEQIKYLTRMIDNILLVSRLDHIPDLDLQPLNPNQIITQIEARLHPQINDKQHTFHLDLNSSPPLVMADLDEFDRALTNLIQNAIKYTPEGGTITVATRTKADQVEIEIADTGIGISADDLPHIFERFYRTDSGKRTNRGTGLGLAIVKRIVTLHNGTIDVDSEPGTGTTFYIRLPACNKS